MDRRLCRLCRVSAGGTMLGCLTFRHRHRLGRHVGHEFRLRAFDVFRLYAVWIRWLRGRLFYSFRLMNWSGRRVIIHVIVRTAASAATGTTTVPARVPAATAPARAGASIVAAAPSPQAGGSGTELIKEPQVAAALSVPVAAIVTGVAAIGRIAHPFTPVDVAASRIACEALFQLTARSASHALMAAIVARVAASCVVIAAARVIDSVHAAAADEGQRQQEHQIQS
jgi:hypothetical protein